MHLSKSPRPPVPVTCDVDAANRRKARAAGRCELALVQAWNNGVVTHLSQDQFPDRFEVSAKQEKICVKRLVVKGETATGYARIAYAAPQSVWSTLANDEQELLPPPIPPSLMACASSVRIDGNSQQWGLNLVIHCRSLTETVEERSRVTEFASQRSQRVVIGS